jgi:hypothetical protein
MSLYALPQVLQVVYENYFTVSTKRAGWTVDGNSTPRLSGPGRFLDTTLAVVSPPGSVLSDYDYTMRLRFVKQSESPATAPVGLGWLCAGGV